MSKLLNKDVMCSMVKACSLTQPPVCRNFEGHGSTARYTPSALIGYRDIQWKSVNPNLVQHQFFLKIKKSTRFSHKDIRKPKPLIIEKK